MRYWMKVKASCKKPWKGLRYIYLSFKIYTTLYIHMMLGGTIAIPYVYFVNQTLLQHHFVLPRNIVRAMLSSP